MKKTNFKLLSIIAGFISAMKIVLADAVYYPGCSAGMLGWNYANAWGIGLILSLAIGAALVLFLVWLPRQLKKK